VIQLPVYDNDSVTLKTLSMIFFKQCLDYSFALKCALFVVAVMVVSPGFADDIIFLKQNSEPKYLESNDGLCDQIYALMAKQLSTVSVSSKVDPIAYPIKRILRMLELGEAHVFCGAGDNAERRALFAYSALPVYSVSNVLVTHEDQALTPSSFDEIVKAELVIGAFYGTSSAKWLKEQNDEMHVNDNHHSLDSVMNLIASNRGLRYFYYHDLGLNHYVKSRGLPLKVLPTKFRTVPQWLLISKVTDAAVIQKINQALAAITESGELAKIHTRFLN